MLHGRSFSVRTIFIVSTILIFFILSLTYAQSNDSQKKQIGTLSSWGVFTPYESISNNPQQGLKWTLENARVIGDLSPTRFLSVDRFAHKYPSLTPYHYVLNNPLRFTDLTGDTVDVDPRLLDPVVYTEEVNKDQQKKLEDMTHEERQRFFFQQWWSQNSQTVQNLFGIGGKFETTNIAFNLGYQPLGFWDNLLTPPKLKNQYFGRTAFGKHGTNENDLFKGSSEVSSDFGIDQLSMFIYLSPARARSTTAPHEFDHVKIIFDRVKRGLPVPTGLVQHELMRKGLIPRIN